MFANICHIKQSSSWRSRSAGPALCAGAVAVLFSASLHAHEVGTTRVSVLFDEGRTYDVEIVTDAAALVDKLEALAGGTSPPNASPAHLQSLLAGFDERFRQRLHISFDASEVRPAIAYSVASGSDASAAPIATIRLTGQVPARARHFTWSYAWTFASYALTIRGTASSSPTTASLEGDQSSAPFALPPPASLADRLRTAWRYLTLGFANIVPRGLDHMLFVLGLYLLSGHKRSVLWQVGAFTVAHSITLWLGVYGKGAVPLAIVEPLMALSIAYVAIENVFLSELTSRRVALVFAFGLLHGMTLAGALRELALPRSEFVTALVPFTVGVEAGQLAVIGAAFTLVGWQYGNRVWYRSRIVVPVSMMIACTAVYWTLVRLSF